MYGFDNPSPAPDLWMRDDPAHAGPNAWSGRFWDSPDLWVRNRDDGGTTHQPPEFGQDNWFHARVRNRGAALVRHFVVTFAVKQFAGTQFSYAADFLPCTAAACGFDLTAGATILVKARWPRSAVPAAGSHGCLLAAVLTRSDKPAAGLHVWEHNNLAQKNLTIVDMLPNRTLTFPFIASNASSKLPRNFKLELIRPTNLPSLQASLIGDALASRDQASDLDCAGAVPVAEAAADSGADAGTPFAAGPVASIPLRLAAQEQMHLRLTPPATVRRGERFVADIVQRRTSDGAIVGGIAVELRGV